MATVTQRSFAAGEIAPALYARVDTVRYATGLKTCRNHMIMRYGGASSRPGTQWTGYAGSQSVTRMIPFVFNNSQTYVLVFADSGIMRVIQNGFMLFDPTKANTITNVTNANPAVVTTTVAHGLTSGREVTLAGVKGLNDPATGLPALDRYTNPGFKLIVGGTTTTVNVLSSTTFSIDLDTSGFSAYVSGGTLNTPYQITHTYLASALQNLRYTQSFDTITLVHPDYPPAQLVRHGDTSWTLSDMSMGPSITPPTGLTINPTPGTDTYYVVTSVSAQGEESAPSTPLGASGQSTVTSPFGIDTITPTGSVAAAQYNIYKGSRSSFGYIGSATPPMDNFADRGYVPDFSNGPPIQVTPFSGSGNYPSAVTYFKQRLFFANTNNAPEQVFGSQVGFYPNFDIHLPTGSSDAVNFTIGGSGRANPVAHLLALRALLIFTSGGEWAASGGTNGALTPSEINLTQYSASGISNLPPLVVGSDALFVQARGSIVRDLGFDFATDTYKGNDLTIFSNHLVDGFTLTDWTYAQTPNSIVWIVRSDGALLGLTYLKEQQIFAWHRHDFDGTVENVCSVPEGTEDAVYLVIKRTINGRTVRYVERMGTRLITQDSDVTRYVGMDCSAAQDGSIVPGVALTLSGGTNWDHTEFLTLTAASALFSHADDAFILTGSDGSTVRFVATVFSSSTVLQGRVDSTVPASLRATRASSWKGAIKTVTGLWPLEGKAVSVLADGNVIASPNNPAYPVITVHNGAITLPDYFVYVRAGLPITCDLETLDIDNAQGATLAAMNKNLTEVTLYLDKSRGIFVGGKAPKSDAIDPAILTELRSREAGDLYTSPAGLKTGKVKQQLATHWNSHGRVFIRQVDPLPASVLAVAPSGFIPTGGG